MSCAIEPDSIAQDTSKSCKEYILKGASWAAQPKGAVIGYQISGTTLIRTQDYGFRVLRDNN